MASLDLLELGNGKKSDADIMMVKGKMKAVRHGFFWKVGKEFEFGKLLNDVKKIQCRISNVCT